jgi:hypothetical protein
MTPGRAEDRSAVERLFTAEARYLPPVCDAAARTRGDPRLWVDDDEDGSVTTLAVGPVAVEGRDAVARLRVRYREPAQEYSDLGNARRRRRSCGAPSRNAPTGREPFLPGLLSRIDQQSGNGSRVDCLSVKCGLARRLDERGVLDDLEVLAGDLVLAQMVGGDGNLQHLKSGLDLLGSGDVLLVILRRVQLCGDGCGE